MRRPRSYTFGTYLDDLQTGHTETGGSLQARTGRSARTAAQQHGDMSVLEAAITAAAKLGDKISNTLAINESTLSGAIDVIVVEQVSRPCRKEHFARTGSDRVSWVVG